MLNKPYSILLALAMLPFSAFAGLDTYQIDTSHSFAKWQIRHRTAKVIGTFSNVTGTIEINPARLQDSKVLATINVFSLNSYHPQRTAHILGMDFLEATKFKTIQFMSTSVQTTSREGGLLKGELTLHGVTKEVSLPFKVLGFGDGPWGGYRSGFEIRTQLKRSDYGITWGLDQPEGGIVGDEIEVTLLIEGIKLAPDGTPWKKPLEIEKTQ
jgi:polyisoprenoid-binding protein YceI